MAQAPDLNDAVADVMASRSTWHTDDVINDQFGVTADECDTILKFVAAFPSSD